MTKRDVLFIAVKLLGLVSLVYALTAIAQTLCFEIAARQARNFNADPSIIWMYAVYGIILSVTGVVFLACAGPISRRLAGEDTQLPAELCSSSQRSVLAVALRNSGRYPRGLCGSGPGQIRYNGFRIYGRFHALGSGYLRSTLGRDWGLPLTRCARFSRHHLPAVQQGARTRPVIGGWTGMTRRDVLPLALKILALAFIIHMVKETARVAYLPLSGTNHSAANWTVVVASWLLDLVVVIVLLAFSDRLALWLMPADEPIPASTSPNWEPSVLSVSLRVAGTAIMALWICPLFSAIVLCYPKGRAEWPFGEWFSGQKSHWPDLVGVVLMLMAAGYLMTGAKALVKLLYRTREAEDAGS